MTVYDGPGRGRKQCSDCGTYTHVRQKNCPSCSAAFGEKVKADAPAKVASTPVVLPVKKAGVNPFKKLADSPDIKEKIRKQMRPQVVSAEPLDELDDSDDLVEPESTSDSDVSSIVPTKKSRGKDYSYVDELSQIRLRVGRELRMLSQSFAKEYIAGLWKEVFGEPLVTKDEYLVERSKERERALEAEARKKAEVSFSVPDEPTVIFT